MFQLNLNEMTLFGFDRVCQKKINDSIPGPGIIFNSSSSRKPPTNSEVVPETPPVINKKLLSKTTLVLLYNLGHNHL